MTEDRGSDLEKFGQGATNREKGLQSAWRDRILLTVFCAFVAAITAAIGNAYVAYVNNSHELVLEAIRTGDPDRAAENLTFLPV